MEAYNNFLIFRTSFFHLVEGVDLYSLHSSLHLDLFKYSPAFSALFAPFAILPAPIGLAAWILTNFLAFVWAVQILPIPLRDRAIVFWFCLPELLGSVQNLQSNALIAALWVMAFYFSQANNSRSLDVSTRSVFFFSLATSLNFLIKIYGGLAWAFGFFGPISKRKLIAPGVLIAAGILVPAAIFPNGTAQLQSWLELLRNDHSTSYGLSLLGLLRLVWGEPYDPFPIQLLGVAALLLVFLSTIQRNRPFDFLIFGLLWLIAMNHKSESPTYILASLACAIWWRAHPQTYKSWFAGFFFFFTSIASSDLMPPALRHGFFEKWELKALPASLLLFIVGLQILWDHFRRDSAQAPNKTAPAI